MVFRKSGLLPMNLNFEYNGEIIEIVKVFSYFFTAGGSLNQTQITQGRQFNLINIYSTSRI